jgi:hypothetical protein
MPRQGWTVTITLWDKPKTDVFYNEEELRASVVEMMRLLPIDFTYQHIYIKKHKRRLKKT